MKRTLIAGLMLSVVLSVGCSSAQHGAFQDYEHTGGVSIGSILSDKIRPRILPWSTRATPSRSSTTRRRSRPSAPTKDSPKTNPSPSSRTMMVRGRSQEW